MHEVLHETGANESSTNVAVFALANLGLMVIAVVFAYGVFTGMDQLWLGLLLSAGFALIAVSLLVYSRINFPHRIVLEEDDELW
ncbi:MAG: hypothetical protein ACOCY7_02350 [Halodesulfurarchaeum sp.]